MGTLLLVQKKRPPVRATEVACTRRPPGESGQRLSSTAELDFLSDHFGDDGQPVLNAQPLDVAMLELATILDQGLPRRVQVLCRRFRISVRLRSNSVRIYRAVLLVLSLRISLRKVRTIFQTMNAAPTLTVITQHYVFGEPKLRADSTFGF
jgi:hypothetical protein